jgi:hypothetical protein
LTRTSTTSTPSSVGLGVDLLGQRGHQLQAVLGDHLLDGALAELVAQAGVDALREQPRGPRLSPPVERKNCAALLMRHLA